MNAILRTLKINNAASALLLTAILAVGTLASTPADARWGGGRGGVGVGRVGSGIGFRPGIGVGRAGIGVRGWANGPGIGGRWGYGGWRGYGYGAAALAGAAALGYAASGPYYGYNDPYGYGYNYNNYNGLYGYQPTSYYQGCTCH
jgi:hypothetical protein